MKKNDIQTLTVVQKQLLKNHMESIQCQINIIFDQITKVIVNFRAVKMILENFEEIEKK